MAKEGDAASPETLIEATPADCYLCLRVSRRLCQDQASLLRPAGDCGLNK